MRIEGLWGSPPPPVWPGSPQTALIFVGLPLLTALVLVATPLHDAVPSAPREEVVAPLRSDLPNPKPRIADRGIGAAAMPRAVASRQPTADDGVPAVIYETRRIVHRSRENGRERASGSEPFTLAATGRRAPHASAATLAPQSP